MDTKRGSAGRLTAIAAAVLTLVLASGWLLVSMAAGKAGLREAVTSGSLSQASATQAVTRAGTTEQGAGIQVVYATPEYYEHTGQMNLIKEMGTDTHLVFVVTESQVDPKAPAPMPELVVDGAVVKAQVTEKVLSASAQGRTRVLQFARNDAQGKPYAGPQAKSLELKWPQMQMAHAADHTLINPLKWSLPVAFAVVYEQKASPFIFLTLVAGLFAALSPCLIQLTAYYLSTLAGVSLTQGVQDRGARGPVVRTALWFVAGVVIAYTAGGALAGLVGEYLATSGVLGAWNRPIAIAAGISIVVMGVYTGAAARAPMLCKLPLPRLVGFAQGKGPLGTMLMGLAVALGCLQCFGGAVFASVLVYVGSLGSPLLGASLLFVFSLGVAIPFLAAAFAWSHVAPHLTRLERITPYVALFSSAIMIVLGALMVADRFHWVSSVILRLMPFLQA